MKIERTTSNYLTYLIEILYIASVFGIVKYFIWKDSQILSFIILVFICRENIYKRMDLILPMKLIKEDNQLYLVYMFIRIKLNVENCFLIIENVLPFIISRRPGTEYGLVLVRNDKKMLFRILKNRIKIQREDYRGVEGLVSKMNLIKDEFGIRTVDFFEDPFKW